MALYSWLFSSNFVDYSLTSATVAVMAILCGVYAMQSKLIYVPDFPPGSRKQVWRPSRFGWTDFEDFFLDTADGVRIHVFWMPSHRKKPIEVPTLLFFHANAGNVGHRLPILRQIAELVDINIFAISYRGYGESEGTPSEAGLRKDAQAALDKLLSCEKVDKKRIIVYGQSIGGAVAIDLTARNQSKVAALMVENTFRSLPELIPHVMPVLGWAKVLCHQKWESAIRMKEMTEAPLPKMLFLSGSRDELIPPAHMKSLFNTITASEDGLKKARFEVFEKGTHNDTCLQPGYFEAIAAFIKTI
ncbi:hypothetical protein PSACC_00244 [Paramicrosporidium saccamoebae]|uniref:AB hydrolase-1 domain-containing protein n=1 Tax=Paramicrosporidium saccamoebae TaxID=1246581 RepID=A0A2H9TQD3_9FUNG|nr:hypothetical protein PSACC_00244 [Paramicrosporidium saccamoebae]